jgi:hypothetical protein
MQMQRQMEGQQKMECGAALMMPLCVKPFNEYSDICLYIYTSYLHVDCLAELMVANIVCIFPYTAETKEKYPLRRRAVIVTRWKSLID